MGHLMQFRLFDDLADHEARTPADFLVNAADILANDAETEDPDADQEVKDGKQSEYAFRFGPDNETADEQEQHERQAAGRNQDPEQREQLQWYDGESGDKIEVEANKVVQTVFRFAGRARGVFDFHVRRIG